MPIGVLSSRDFWRDICRSRDNYVFFYQSTNTAIARGSFLEGLKKFKGDQNEIMNKAIGQMCKNPPLNLLAFPKAWMDLHGAGDLFNLKTQIIQAYAENIIR